MLINLVSLLNLQGVMALGWSIFPYGFLNLNNVKIQVSGWVRRYGLFKLKRGKILKNQDFSAKN